MRKTKTNRMIAMFLVFVMALTMVTTTALATSAYDYYQPKEVTPAQSLEDADRYFQETLLETYREDLYRYVSDKANLLPTDLEPTPLPEELGLDPATYWKEISLDGNTTDATTRSTEELYQEIRQLVSDLTGGLTTPSEKYAAIYRWVDDNIGYSTNNRTHNVYLAYERGYGACMEKSNLTYLMATLAGLKVAIMRSPEHQGTAVSEEHNIWVGDGYKAEGGGAIPTEAFYIDGTTKYHMNLQTGAVQTLGTISTPEPAYTFNDVPVGAWYAKAVNWAVAKGITNGTGNNTFSPVKTCTNTEIITFLYRANGSPAVDNSVVLPFTVKNSWAADAIKWAYSKGVITAGFDENAYCTRATAVDYIYKASGSPEIYMHLSFTDLDGYTQYLPAIKWAVSKSIVNGTSATTFSPTNVCDRATIVTLLYRAYSG